MHIGDDSPPPTLRWATLSIRQWADKEGCENQIPSFLLAEERVVERSNDRVSHRRHTMAKVSSQPNNITHQNV